MLQITVMEMAPLTLSPSQLLVVDLFSVHGVCAYASVIVSAIDTLLAAHITADVGANEAFVADKALDGSPGLRTSKDCQRAIDPFCNVDVDSTEDARAVVLHLFSAFL